MLYGLFGNRNVERILLFLFVNEKCYATQMQSLLQVPLTPIQKALQRLEKESIIKSLYEGKIRMFRFNLNYPLYNELEIMLKKMYTLLSPQEKKVYCFIHKPRLLFVEEIEREKARKTALLDFWNRLKDIKYLSLSTQSRQKGETLFKTGKAEVQSKLSAPTTIIFQERGVWVQDQYETTFSNSFRWTLDINAALITLEHVRYGIENPVFLFHLTPTQYSILESVDAHLCGEDTYLGNVTWDHTKIDFHWRIIGTKKNDHLRYRYS